MKLSACLISAVLLIAFTITGLSGYGQAVPVKIDSGTMLTSQAGIINNYEVTQDQAALDQAEIELLNARIDLVITAAQYRAVLPAQAEKSSPVPVPAPTPVPAATPTPAPDEAAK